MTTQRRNPNPAEAGEQAVLISGRGDVGWTPNSGLTGERDELRFTGVIFKPSATTTFCNVYAHTQQDAIKTQM